MRIMVTGGAGFIGSHIVDALAIDNFVYAMDDESGGSFANVAARHAFNVRTRNMDCGKSFRDMCNCMKSCEIDTLVHCAANAREGASQFQPDSVTRRNFQAYMCALSAAIAAGVKRVVLFSSMSVYGDQDPPFNEDMPLKPVDVYAVNKAAMETSTAILADVHDFKYVIIRPHNVFGDRQCLTDIHRNVVAIFMNRIMREEPLFIYGDGNQTRAFSYISDSMPSFMKAICNVEQFHGHAINIGGMENITVNQLADTVCASMGVAKDYPREYLEDRPREVKHAYTTYEKSQQLLQYTERTGWKQGVFNMAGWAKQQGPKDWHTTDRLELINDKTPKPWVTER